MRKVGEITDKVAVLLGIERPLNVSIMLGGSNIRHMQEKHPEDYRQYGDRIAEILSDPDYVGRNPKDESIEYVKEYVIDGKYVKVAVRLSNSGIFYARSLYVLKNSRVENYIAKGTLKRVT